MTLIPIHSQESLTSSTPTLGTTTITLQEIRPCDSSTAKNR